MKEKKQTEQFNLESYRYISSYINDKEKPDLIIPQSLKSKTIETILDVGCGNGVFLNNWKNFFSTKRAVGIEPSEDGIKLIKKKWQKEKGLNFQSSFAHNLPFESDSFDLVTAWSVLHWIGRNEYLQSIGEMIRVCSKYLLVMDFVAKKNYRTPYYHAKGLYTYKQDFEILINASGIMKKLEVMRWWVNPQNGKVSFLKKGDLDQFEGNNISYYARKLVVYEKDYSLLPIKNESDFK
jgi:ubiquinone/menaquinone biosynthesis C-methylase UbiE